MSKNLCNCKEVCDRWGVFDDGSGGYFAPYNPFSDTLCKKTINKLGDNLKPKIIKKDLDK